MNQPSRPTLELVVDRARTPPPRGFLLGVLEEAVRVLVAGPGNDPARRRIFADVREWLLHDDPDEPLSFQRVCAVVDIDADAFRAALACVLRLEVIAPDPTR